MEKMAMERGGGFEADGEGWVTGDKGGRGVG